MMIKIKNLFPRFVEHAIMVDFCGSVDNGNMQVVAAGGSHWLFASIYTANGRYCWTITSILYFRYSLIPHSAFLISGRSK